MHHIPQLFSAQDGCLTGETTLSEGVGIPLSFGHAYITLMICLAGRALVSLNFKDQVLRPHDVLVLAEDTMTLLKRRSQGFKVFFLLMPKNLASEVAYPLPNSLFVFLHDNPLCVPLQKDRALLAAWLVQLRQIVQARGLYQHIMLRNQLQNFFLRIAEQIPSEYQGSQSFSRKEMISWRFWELVGQQCRKHRQVKFYADALNITPFYLSQLSKEFFNDSPKVLIDRQVVLEIKALLSYSQLAIGQIADQLSFEDPSYLCRYFKRHTGLSLTRYRQHEQARAGVVAIG
ncbi:helix-turn-helix domain-containing protein [Alcaligenes aquatilis]|uniref:AraC family transcriptional regulator n=1 Tax=Alcaligenes aquatilis TaxID=323284 RepID=UPI003F8DCBFA